MLKNIIVLILSIISVIFAVELFIRCTGKYSTYSESTGNGYMTYWGYQLPSWYWLHKPSSRYIESNVDFTYENSTNSMGHRELEPSKVLKDNSIKVIVLGDSYIEGVGVPYDSSITKWLQYFSRNDSPEFSFYNAGVAGSDPFFSYSILRDSLFRLEPNLIIVAINPSDFSDFVFRGGRTISDKWNYKVQRKTGNGANL